jgi:hypothetical protein
MVSVADPLDAALGRGSGQTSLKQSRRSAHGRHRPGGSAAPGVGRRRGGLRGWALPMNSTSTATSSMSLPRMPTCQSVRLRPAV